jgi:energy-coupling factor transport system substrate-specific component
MSWQLTSFLILGLVLALGFGWYERSRPPARVLALVAALAALAVVGRLAFAPFPNVKPTTDIVLFAGYALGGAPGFAVGAVTALVSNIFLSHGPWTPWQMAAWGGVGIAGGTLGAVVRRVRHRRSQGDAAGVAEPPELGRWSLALACGLAGLGFGVVMDVYLWTLGAEQTAASYVAIAARSLPFNLAHVAGNVAFCLLIGPPLVRALRRYRRRFEVRWPAPAPTTTAAITALALATLSLAGPPVAHAAAPDRKQAVGYLLGSQNSDGGFGARRGAPSGGTTTGEVALGLAAAGRNPHDVSRRGNSVVDWTRRNIGSVRSVGDIERTVLVLGAAGNNPRRRFAGRNLYEELVDHHDGGSFGGSPNHAAYGVLALRAAGERPDSSLVRQSLRWLEDNQDKDGGFGLGSSGEVDITAAALAAFGAAGEADSDAARAAAAFLDGAQQDAGGFNYYAKPAPASASAGSTAWAVQGLSAAGHGGGSTVSNALSYLGSIQARDGSVPHTSAGNDPVWGTGQAVMAMYRKSPPIDPPPRRPTRPAPSPGGEGVEEAGSTKGKAGGTKGSNDNKRRRRLSRKPLTRAGSGSGPGRLRGSSPGDGPASGRGPLAPDAGADGPGAGGPAAPFIGPPPAPGLPPALAIPNAAAGALASPPIPLPGATPNPLGSPGRLLSDAGGVPLTPLASKASAPDREGNPGPRIGAGTLLILVVAGAIALATGGGARARRLWATARGRT